MKVKVASFIIPLCLITCSSLAIAPAKSADDRRDQLSYFPTVDDFFNASTINCTTSFSNHPQWSSGSLPTCMCTITTPQPLITTVEYKNTSNPAPSQLQFKPDNPSYQQVFYFSYQDVNKSSLASCSSHSLFSISRKISYTHPTLNVKFSVTAQYNGGDHTGGNISGFASSPVYPSFSAQLIPRPSQFASLAGCGILVNALSCPLRVCYGRAWTDDNHNHYQSDPGWACTASDTHGPNS